MTKVATSPSVLTPVSPHLWSSLYSSCALKHLHPGPLSWAPDICIQLSPSYPHSDVRGILRIIITPESHPSAVLQWTQLLPSSCSEEHSGPILALPFPSLTTLIRKLCEPDLPLTSKNTSSPHPASLAQPHPSSWMTQQRLPSLLGCRDPRGSALTRAAEGPVRVRVQSSLCSLQRLQVPA